jgi:hypothetical protein
VPIADGASLWAGLRCVLHPSEREHEVTWFQSDAANFQLALDDDAKHVNIVV